MKKHLTTILLVLIFLIGLSVLLYPTVADYINAKHQSRAIANYVEGLASIDPVDYSSYIEEAQAYNKSLLGNSTRFSPSEEEIEAYHGYLGANNSVIGYVEIPAIGVELPMYLGTEESVLQVGIGCMPGSSLPIGGASTHAVLTGHRGLPSARLLTDLDQVVVGDVFTVFALNETLTYQVDQIHIVLPTELQDLAIEEGKDYCTLVTCTPYGINSHRMLVRGHRIDNIEEVEEKVYRVTSDAIQIDPLLVAVFAAIPILLVLGIGVMVGGGKKRG